MHRMVAALLAVWVVPSVVAQQGPGAESRKPTIAVLDFRLAKGTSKASVGGREIKVEQQTGILTDKLIAALAKAAKFTLVEREKLNTILDELMLSEVGVVDPKSAIKAGKLLGADYFVFGTLTHLSGAVREEQIPFTQRTQKCAILDVGVDFRVVDTRTGKVVAADSYTDAEQHRSLTDVDFRGGISNEKMTAFLVKTAEELAHRIVDAIYPIKVVSADDQSIYINRGSGTGIKEGDIFVVMVLGKDLRDPDTGEVLGQEWNKVATIKITTVDKKLSKATVEQWHVEKKAIPAGSIVQRAKATE